MHPALSALRGLKDKRLIALGFNRARERGLLGSYMEMMNRGGSGGYRKEWIVAAKMKPGTDPLPKAR